MNLLLHKNCSNLLKYFLIGLFSFWGCFKTAIEPTKTADTHKCRIKYVYFGLEVIYITIFFPKPTNDWLHGIIVGLYVAPLFLLQTPLLGHLALDIGP